jgi:Lon protease-like protein
MVAPPNQVNLPLFALGIVAIPSELVPLHIFESRYLAMIEQCLQSKSEFGIVWIADGEHRSIGCACEVDRVLERTPDGQLNILVRGRSVFRLIERHEEPPYPIGLVEFLLDDPDDGEVESASRARGLYAELLEQATDRVVDVDDLREIDSYEMAATVDFGSEAKQQLLELRSENARMVILERLLRAAIKRLELADHAQERARSNGKIHFR